jgi:hypothetical protein
VILIPDLAEECRKPCEAKSACMSGRPPLAFAQALLDRKFPACAAKKSREHEFW